MDQLKSMKEQLIAQVQGQLGNIRQADAQELGAAMDMIKDLAMTEYYCSVVEAMEKADKEKENGNNTNTVYYTERYYPTEMRDMDRSRGQMYYSNYYDEVMHGGTRDYGGRRMYDDWNRMYGGMRNYENPNYTGGNDSKRDYREGSAGQSRKMYMESKELHQEKEKRMKELESYVHDLGSDITDMISDASPEEKAMLQKKLAALANKVELLNK